MLEAVFYMGLLRGYINRPTGFLQEKLLRNIRNFPSFTPFRDLHTALNHPYVYNCITKLCSQQAEVIQNHENECVHSTGQGEGRLAVSINLSRLYNVSA